MVRITLDLLRKASGAGTQQAQQLRSDCAAACLHA